MRVQTTPESQLNSLPTYDKSGPPPLSRSKFDPVQEYEFPPPGRLALGRT
jgi:hypothetical protein